MTISVNENESEGLYYAGEHLPTFRDTLLFVLYRGTTRFTANILDLFEVYTMQWIQLWMGPRVTAVRSSRPWRMVCE